jgi:hypothetical protein
VSDRANAVEPMQRRSSNEHDGGVRTAVHWLRKAIRARIGASRYPKDRDALENIAEIYEQIAERMTELDIRPNTKRPPCLRGGEDP